MINLLANSAYSSIAPFFPKEALEKGVYIWSIGFVFAGYSLSMFICAPLFVVIMNNVGRKNCLILGCFCESVAMLCFGLLDYIDGNPVLFFSLCMCCRFVEGFGNGCLNSATSSLIQFNYPENANNLISLTQTFTGIGMLTGPIIGSLLYESGGYKLPFYSCGLVLFLLILPIICLVKDDL